MAAHSCQALPVHQLATANFAPNQLVRRIPPISNLAVNSRTLALVQILKRTRLTLPGRLALRYEDADLGRMHPECFVPAQWTLEIVPGRVGKPLHTLAVQQPGRTFAVAVRPHDGNRIVVRLRYLGQILEANRAAAALRRHRHATPFREVLVAVRAKLAGELCHAGVAVAADIVIPAATPSLGTLDRGRRMPAVVALLFTILRIAAQYVRYFKPDDAGRC
uniref:Uncharacterized protein n=1 Tax=Anopheles melas TaxID=34690 RepID=A0A182TCV3_9DIPT